MTGRTLLCLFVTAIFVGDFSSSETIFPCEQDGQYIADRNSCTKFHRCRALSTEGPSTKFTTDIAICNYERVFDLVTQQCVDIGEGLLQDPDNCDQYYGCDVSQETSEGYVRSHYICPGALRFHPGVRRCVYKTRVQDTLCNNLSPNQMIIRADIGAGEENFNPLDILRRPSFSSKPVGNLIPFAPTRDQQPPNIVSSSLSAAAGNRLAGAKGDPLPKPANDIEEIAKVISGQLFTLRDKTQEDQKQSRVIPKESRTVPEKKVPESGSLKGKSTNPVKLLTKESKSTEVKKKPPQEQSKPVEEKTKTLTEKIKTPAEKSKPVEVVSKKEEKKSKSNSAKGGLIPHSRIISGRIRTILDQISSAKN